MYIVGIHLFNARVWNTFLLYWFQMARVIQIHRYSVRIIARNSDGLNSE